ncbi:hypothetical protein [Longitalea luteola]|uniref:hypothetical protein n=1 Tax=Longitalea luteola TaxID=2812563 RepID=UPI001A96DAA9|nr:hypothetical protein [Longitalea luteola]
MAVTNEKYDQFKIERLKNFLEDMAAKGQPRYYEIFVDSLKVVPKTDNAEEFENYERYIDDTTEKVRIVIYGSGLSPRNDQYSFHVQPTRQDKGLSGFNGLGDLDGIIQEKLATRDREYEMTRLREELQKVKDQLVEAEEYAETLEEQIKLLQDNKYKLGSINVAELASVALEGMIRRNPQLLTKLPGGEALAGIIEQDNQERQQLSSSAQVEAQASFQKKSTDQIKPEQLRYIPLLQQLDAAFNTAELEVVMQVLQRLADEPTNLKTVAELLNIQTP